MFDDKPALTYNYRDGTESITLEDVQIEGSRFFVLFATDADAHAPARTAGAPLQVC